MPGDDSITDAFSRRRNVMLNAFVGVAGTHDEQKISATWQEYRNDLAGARGIFVVNDGRPELSIPGDQDFGETGFLRCLMGSKQLLNIQNRETAREFRYSAPIYCDTNFVSFCGTFFAGRDLGANAKGFLEAIKFLLPIRNNLNAWAYMLENADNTNLDRMRDSLIGFAALKLTSPEDFLQRGSFVNTRNEELERIADACFETMRGPDFRLIHDELVKDHYTWSHVILLKSVLISFTNRGKGVETKMRELYGFLNDELARLPQFETYAAFRFFSLNEREPFFSGVQANASNLNFSIKSMAWDLAHWRTLFELTMIFSIRATNAAFPVPHFLSFDRRFVRLAETFKLDGLIYAGDSRRCEQFLSRPLLDAVSDLLRGSLGEFRTDAAIEDRKRRVAESQNAFDARLFAVEAELSEELANFLQARQVIVPK